MTLVPAFAGATASYTTETTNSTNTITATPLDSSAIVTILNGTTPVVSGTSATWLEGENTVTITVKLGTTIKTYTVIVTKSTL